MRFKSSRREAFSMLELVFAIVIIGILGKFGVEFLAQAYNNFIFSKINNELQANSAYAVEFIGKRLEHRIKQSTIYRNPTNLGNSTVNFRTLDSGTDANASVLEWIATDIEGYRVQNWSGILDFNPAVSNQNVLTSLETNTTAIHNLIQNLSNNTSGVNDAAIYFVGTFAANNIWGWDGNTTHFNTLANVEIHPITTIGTAGIDEFHAARSDGTANTFTGVAATEYYKLAWTAYAVSLENNATTGNDDLFLYSNYQPWQGHQYDDTQIILPKKQKTLILHNVSSFQFRAVGSLIKIQVCSRNNLIANEAYSVCKEKTIY